MLFALAGCALLAMYILSTLDHNICSHEGRIEGKQRLNTLDVLDIGRYYFPFTGQAYWFHMDSSANLHAVTVSRQKPILSDY